MTAALSKGRDRIGSRWITGLAFVIGLTAGGLGVAQATSPSSAVALVPIQPCRVTDTRPELNVGDRSTPLDGGQTMTVSVRSSVSNPKGGGACDGIVPLEATAVSLNVTAVGASAETFLTVWPTGNDRPNASSLNPAPGSPPTPNAVVTGLSASGEFNIFNLAGSLHLVIDVNGYYVDHHHDDRYPTRAELASRDPLQIVVGSEEFVGDSAENVVYGVGSVEARDTGGSSAGSCAVAPAHVPHRATMTRVRIRMRDLYAPDDAFVRLMSYELSGTEQRTLAFVESTGTSSQLRTFVSTEISVPTVDVTAYRYILQVCTPTLTELHDVVINYTLPG